MIFQSRGVAGGLIALLCVSGQAQANDGFRLFGGDASYTGLLRVETAFSTSNQTAPSNQHGDAANGLAINRRAGNPATNYTTTIEPELVTQLIQVGSTTLNLNGIGFAPTRGVTNLSPTGASDTFTRYVPSRDQDLNYHILRFEASPAINWDNGFSFQARIRAIYDPGDMGYQDFDAGDYADLNGGFDGGASVGRGNARQFKGKPDYLGYSVEGDKHPLLFERSGRHYQIDLPAFFAQWNNGDVTVRLGNQSVAWGQLLFFRVMDVANGLDLRRHLIIDRALEEYADERMAAPGLRLTWQASDTLLVDMFAQQFVPTVLNNVNTPYNLVPSQFYIRDRYKEFGSDDELNYGIRIKGEYGNFSLQAMATSRLNPFGAIRWTKSGVNKALPNTNTLGAAFNLACPALITAFNLANNTDLDTTNGCGGFLAETSFEASPAGVFSAEEWFDRAGYIRLHGIEGANRVIDEFPAAQAVALTSGVGQNVDAANNLLDAFFIAAEGLHGHIERSYHREEIFGLGGGYVVDAEPGSLLDQLIMNVELTYAKDRTFTAIDLRQAHDVREEYQFGFVAEKYQRFSTKFPATYLVFQYLWQKQSDLAGLLLDGYTSENFSDQDVRLNVKVPTNANPKIAQGVDGGGAHYLVFAFLQPTDAYVFEFSAATLIDVYGGVLVQPAVQWKPRGNLTVNLYYNYINGDAWGGNQNGNLMGLFDFADEAVLRLGYQF